MTNKDIDSILKPYQRFGVHLGLERIRRLLANLGNPQQQVPVIHVAGTNGKGSVCAYLSAVLKEAGYRVGRYTSPHLVDWTERICLDEQPIAPKTLQQILLQVQQAISPDEETPTQFAPTQFEIITAAAWLYFAQVQVDIAVIEVGLGGRLDATNVCDRPLVTVITSISREHWQQLGPTVADIAREKAGILKPNCPAVIGQLPPEAETVVRSRLVELGCPAIFPLPSRQTEPGWAEFRSEERGVRSEGEKNQLPTTNYQLPTTNLKYPLPLLGDIQLMNSALAIAALQILQQQGWKISDEAIANGMGKAKWLGRLQWTTWQNRQLLIDGAHNPAAAQALRQYVDTLEQPVCWVMGMLSTKDHADIFRALLRPKDELHLVPVPDHSTADPEILAKLAREVCPQLATCYTYPDLFAGLEAATKSSNLMILCGSLYLVGYFLQTAR
ncbi:bifunctional folylpolyglutamate synthase/dihydrofolate synthase [Scytonema millei]|uniref:tetrahydrofolate synthase n=1 Tax=Scytonema millei VB511283 TaxID=1245923 RepID=A0A9X5E6Z8_9CYAN|nr:folylpolyglutamate synthase/dihydrofolate synthase family protein [Scytonema millei]NHC36279.1 bifunctional folylpolyglutamate synthase/dihydrofolate synthase [Scytonema millei VB511283]